MTVDFTKEELEDSAIELVAAATGFTYHCLDRGRVHENLPDFELLRGDVRVGVLEVTSFRPQDRAGFTAALRKHPIIVPDSRLFWNLVRGCPTVMCGLPFQIPSAIADGVYALSVRGGKATVTADNSKNAPSDVSMDVSALGSLYLGGVRVDTLARTGQVAAKSPATLDLLDALLAHRERPYCVTHF